jgi:hypothetical protein
MTFQLTPGKLGFKLGEVLVGLKEGTTDTPETITSTQNKLHTIGYLWNPDTLAYEVPVQGLTDTELRAEAVPVISADFAGRSPFNTLFGEAVIGWHSDDISVMFQYNNSTRDVTPVVTGSGAITNSDEQAIIGIGAAVGSATLTSVDSIRYRPGHEVTAQFTSVYNGAQSGVNQYHGILVFLERGLLKAVWRHLHLKQAGRATN